VTKARHVAEAAERKKLYDQATEILLREVPSLLSLAPARVHGYSIKVQGFAPHPDGIIRVKGLKLS
jgi:peptide/nickel transport system substrate-binding protein